MVLANVTLFDFLKNTNDTTPDLLPLVHSTETGRLIDILSVRTLSTSPCQFFNHENLLYMFVGRPSYRLRDVDDPELWQLPTVFILKNDIASSAVRIHPFDTGAFMSNRFPSYFSCMKLPEFELRNTDSLRKYLGVFFGSEEKYFSRKATPRATIEEKYNITIRHKAVSGLARLLTESRTSNLDDRSSAAELQFSTSVDISSNNLLGIVLPNEACRDAELLSTIKLFNCEIITYDQMSLSVREYYSEIYSKCKAFYRSKRYI